MKKIFFIYLSAFLSLMAQAQTINQDVIASDGNYSVSPSGSVSWTIGEPVVDTYIGATTVLTKGFHQPHIIILSSIPELNSSGTIFAYPNPVVDNLQLDFSKMAKGVYSINMHDVAGKLLSQSKVLVNSDSFQNSLSLSQYTQGFYLVKITNESNDSSKFFKITKQ